MSEHPADEFCRLTGTDVPLICGAMYPCSNPELVGAVAAAGAMAIVQPLSLIYVHGRDFRTGIQEIKTLAGGRPFGFNAIIEKSAKAYENRMRQWIDIALEEGVRFFVTALGNPEWEALSSMTSRSSSGRKRRWTPASTASSA